jgi:hypothetical protein
MAVKGGVRQWRTVEDSVWRWKVVEAVEGSGGLCKAVENGESIGRM